MSTFLLLDEALAQLINSIFQPNIGLRVFHLHGNGQPKSEGDDFVQDPAPPRQGVPAGISYLPEVDFA